MLDLFCLPTAFFGSRAIVESCKNHHHALQHNAPTNVLHEVTSAKCEAPFAGSMRATLPAARFTALGVAEAHPLHLPRRSLGRAAPSNQVSTSHRSATSVDTRDTGVSAAITSSGPIGQALLEKVNSVSAKAEALLGTRRPPLSSRAPQSLGEKLVDLTERLGQLEKLLDDLRTRGAGVFSPPARVAPPARASTLSAEAAAEASVKAVAKSLLDAARNRSPSGTKTQTAHMHVTPPSCGSGQTGRWMCSRETPITAITFHNARDYIADTHPWLPTRIT